MTRAVGHRKFASRAAARVIGCTPFQDEGHDCRGPTVTVVWRVNG